MRVLLVDSFGVCDVDMKHCYVLNVSHGGPIPKFGKLFATRICPAQGLKQVVCGLAEPPCF